jgi:hypothetical protein
MISRKGSTKRKLQNTRTRHELKCFSEESFQVDHQILDGICFPWCTYKDYITTREDECQIDTMIFGSDDALPC